jgi:5-methylthioadenosine/S-adenosylhomocysteine deaminase
MTQTGITMSRRNLLAGAAAASVSTRAFAQQPRAAAPATGLPQRGEAVIRNAFVMTMNPSIGDLKSADIHIANGVLRAVGPKLSAPGATEIDGRDMIALPGFVDTHTHLWSTQMRGRFGDTPGNHQGA